MRSAVLLLALFTPVAVLAADADLVLQHQGYLLDDSDNPVDGPRTVTVALWANEATGTSIWTETYTVNVSQGRYAIAIGSTENGTKVLSAEHLAGPRWLSVNVEGVELLPRLRVGVAPLAIRADDADKLGGVAASEYALKSDVAAQIAAASPEGYARLNGATFTGQVTLEAAATDPNHATTRGYVDTQIADTKEYVDTQVAAATPVGYAKLDGSESFTGPLTLAGPPTEDLHAVTKAYVDSHRPAPDGNLLVSFDFEESQPPFLDGSSYELSAVAPGSGFAPGSEGHSGKAILFSGGVIAVEPPKTVADSSQIWIETWIEPALPMNTTRTIVAKSGSYTLRQVDRNVQFEAIGARTPSPCLVTTTGDLLEAGQWSHVAAWYDGLSVRVAVDGTVRATAQCPNGPIKASPSSAFVIGGSLDGGTVTEPYAGKIDELRVRATASMPSLPNALLSVTRVQNNVRKAITSGASGLIWEFEYDKKHANADVHVTGVLYGRNADGSDWLGLYWQYGTSPRFYDNGIYLDSGGSSADSHLIIVDAWLVNDTSTGPQTFRIGWQTQNNQAGNYPFTVLNPSQSDDARIQGTTTSRLTFFEYAR